MSANKSYKTKSQHRFGILLISILVLMLFVSSSAFCYELNGTATGNILQGGYNAEGEDFTASSDTENGYALMITQKGKTFTADADNSKGLNVCGNTVYYITVNGYADQTELRSYNVETGVKTVLYTVPLIDGMMHLYISDNCAYFQSNGNVLCFDLTEKTVKTVLTGITEFIPVNDSFLYTIGTDLYYQNTKIAEDCLYFECDEDTVYFSNGEDGIYAKALNGGEAQRIGNGGTSLVSDGSVLYWQHNDMILSYEKNRVNFEQAVDNETTSLEILPDAGITTVEEEIGEGGSTSPDGGLVLNAATTLGMPAGDYKNWKQFDSRWGDVHLGKSNITIRSAGCAATSVAILLVGSGAAAKDYLNGKFDPGIFVTKMTNNDGFTGTGGIYWYRVTDCYPDFQYDHDNKSFSSRGLSNQCSDINSNMANHKYIVMQVKTSGTHFVAADYAKDNTIYVCDPGKSNSNTLAPYNAGNIAYRAVIYHYTGNNSNWGGGNGGGGDQPQPTETVATPSITISSNKVTISCATSGATIYYTIDNSTPTKNSLKYSAPFTLKDNAVIKAFAVKSGYNNSSVVQKSYKKSPFKDVNNGDWFLESVLQAYDAGIINGTGNNLFSPYTNANRAQVVTMISRIIDSEKFEFDNDFVDVKDSDYFFNPVSWACRNDITNGTSETTFSPYMQITREQVCCLLIRMAEYLDTGETGSLLQKKNAKVTFRDDKKISSWAKEDVSLAQQAGLINGNPDGTFRPKEPASRAEIAAMIVRMIGIGN